ncbi:MAG TPA: 3-dehydroquinate synthase [Candidatus Fimivivens faecavium]|nr:3-dehydroquinate synthase [Candidatus Fimivivens faecavium]
MNTVTVSASRRYDIQIGSGLLETLGAVCQSVCPGRAAALIADDNVDRLYGGQAADSLRRAGFSVSKFVFPNGEGSKNLAVLGDALEFLAERGLTRADLVVALGGGVTGDLGGFAASVYQRGIRFVQVPTTLLAMIDSSVGGKTAVNLAHGKNLAGSFYQPSAVLCDHSLLATLSPEIYADGVAEAVKYGAAFDCELFSAFSKGDASQKIEWVITRCVELKRGLVERDERDAGERQLLNFGHTAGHAIERLSGYAVTHGHAVAAGMAIVSRAAWRLGFSDENTAPPLERILKGHRLPVSCPYDAAALAKAALSDKKRAGDTITLVLPKAVGNCVLYPMPTHKLESFFALGLAPG